MEQKKIRSDGSSPNICHHSAIIEDRGDSRGAAMLIAVRRFRCTGSFRSMEEALAKISFDLPDIVLCDIGLPGMSGIEGMRILKERFPNMLLLMLSVYDDDERIFDALCAGACGYLLKKTPPVRLLESLREAVTAARRFAEFARRVIALFGHRPPNDRL